MERGQRWDEEAVIPRCRSRGEAEWGRQNGGEGEREKGRKEARKKEERRRDERKIEIMDGWKAEYTIE